MKDTSDGEDSSESVVRRFQKRRRRLLPRWEGPGEVYHVRSTRLQSRQESLADEAIAPILAEVLHYDDGRRYQLHCYVLMPDHLHALLRPLSRDDGVVPLCEILKAIKGISARRINRLSGTRGSLWLEEAYTRMIRWGDEYRQTWHYIRHNPVKAGYVERAEDWPWWWSRQ